MKRQLTPEQRALVTPGLIKMAYSIVHKNKHKFTNIELDDLKSVALLALCVAATTYEANNNAKFSSYAYSTIYFRLMNYNRDHSRTIKIPARIQENWGKVHTLIEAGKSVEEIAKQLKITKSLVETIKESNIQGCMSIDCTYDESDDSMVVPTYELDWLTGLSNEYGIEKSKLLETLDSRPMSRDFHDTGPYKKAYRKWWTKRRKMLNPIQTPT